MKPDSSRRSCVRGCWWTVATCSTLAATAASANNPLLQLHCLFVFFFFLGGGVGGWGCLSILLQSCPENKVLTVTVTFNFHLAEGCIVFIWKDFFFFYCSTVNCFFPLCKGSLLDCFAIQLTTCSGTTGAAFMTIDCLRCSHGHCVLHHCTYNGGFYRVFLSIRKIKLGQRCDF